MEFDYSSHPKMDMKKDPSFEIDDDVFYAELGRQILRLTSEDEDENAEFRKNKHLKSAAKQGSGFSCSAVPLPGSYFSWSENENANVVPIWLLNLWRHGTGTGVFIPHIAKSIRRHKPGRRNNARGTTYKSVANKNERNNE
ncbi:hypothetical protein CEY00_Acc31285 [Actinidia chinensis var. chinensis]|uniref:Uncharacterized protein n=1 Tax=Actinidia chinensis var. chinensis TaxID=1590841 RepID=A0A2R6PB93_ACTCC|nr:hypothetical protein CEY00_Acc31285 [Actinidia chinensis var. chinensis]